MANIIGVKGSERNSYYMLFIDNATRNCIIRFMKTKDETTAKVQQYLVHIEHQHSLLPKAI